MPAPAASPVKMSAARAPYASPIQPTRGAPNGTLPMKTIRYNEATRPRIAGAQVIWIIAFAVVATVSTLMPTSGRIAVYVRNVGISPDAICSAANSRPPPTMKRIRGTGRRAANRAPASEPIASTDPRMPYSCAPLPNSSVAISALVI